VAKTTHKGPFAPEERDKFIGLIRQGYGIHGALADLKTSHRRYLLTCERVKGFRQAIQHAIVYRLEFLVSLRYAEALGGDSRAQEFLINRHDRRHEFLARLKIDAAAAARTSIAVEDVKTLREHLRGKCDPDLRGKADPDR